MDFGRDCLVFVNNEEKTDNIAEMGVIGASITIKYKYKDLIYSFDTSKATVLSDPKIIDLSQGAVLYHNDIPLSGVTEAYLFYGFYSVFFESEPRRTYPEGSVCVEENTLREPGPDGLDFVHTGSVLHDCMRRQCAAPGGHDDKFAAYPFGADPGQKKAIKTALTNKISIIDGPPGTGRTRTLLNLVLNIAVAGGKTVAVVANDEAVLDRVFGKLDGKGYGFIAARPDGGRPGGSDGGWPCEPEKTGAASPGAGTPEHELEKLQLLEEKEKRLFEKLSLWRLEQRHFAKAKKDRPPKKLKKLPWARLSQEKILRLWADMEMLLSEGKTGSFWTKTKYFLSYGITDFEDLFGGGGESGDIRIIGGSVYALQFSYIAEKIKEIEKELAKCRSELERAKYGKLLAHQTEHADNFLKGMLGERYRDLPRDFDSEGYREEFDEFSMYLKRFPVTFGTVSSIKDSIRQNYVFDYMIFADASGSDPAAAASALSCCKNAVFIGDSKQPAPNLISFVKESLGDAVPRAPLYAEYLCHPDVARFFNEVVYEGGLVAYSGRVPENPDVYYFRGQAGMLSDTLGERYENTDEFARFFEYASERVAAAMEGAAKDNTTPVPDLLYKGYNAVLLPMQNRFLKRSKYKTKNALYAKTDDILSREKYKYLRARYNVRLSDIIDIEGRHIAEYEKLVSDGTANVVIYDVFGKRPGLVIDSENDESPKGPLFAEVGIDYLALPQSDIEDEEKITRYLDEIMGKGKVSANQTF